MSTEPALVRWLADCGPIPALGRDAAVACGRPHQAQWKQATRYDPAPVISLVLHFDDAHATEREERALSVFPRGLCPS